VTGDVKSRTRSNLKGTCERADSIVDNRPIDVISDDNISNRKINETTVNSVFGDHSG